MKCGKNVTCVQYSPNGAWLVAGLSKGILIVYDAKNFNRITQIECKNRMGRYSMGTKVISIQFYIDESEFLVTTYDHRIRRISTSDWKMICKYKGHLNSKT